MIHKNLIFLLPYLLLLIAAVWFEVQEPRGWLVLELNHLHQPDWDAFFRFVTKGGEEWAGIVLGVYLVMFKPRRYLIAYLLAVIAMILVTQGLKRLVFEDWYRPIVVLKDHHLHLVDGVHMNKKFSFPSGHTSAGFLFFAFWAFIMRSHYLKLFFLLSATAVGLSRIYLAQHFLQDVIAGSVIGVFLAVMACSISSALVPKSKWFNELWRSR